MWVAKFKIWHKNCILRPKCIKHNVTDLVYLINSWKDEKSFYYTELHILQGTEENKKKFVKDLKKEKAIKELNQKGNYIITLNKEPLEKEYYNPAFDPKLIQTKPVAQTPSGYEYWELASWDRESLMNLKKIPTFETKLVSITQKILTNIFTPNIFPELSEKQKEAIELAVKEGYYEYPRKKNLDKLSAIAGVTKQTFQENLRKAEKKIIPFLTDNIR